MKPKFRPFVLFLGPDSTAQVALEKKVRDGERRAVDPYRANKER